MCPVRLPCSSRHRVCRFHHAVLACTVDHDQSHDDSRHQPQDPATPAHLPVCHHCRSVQLCGNPVACLHGNSALLAVSMHAVARPMHARCLACQMCIAASQALAAIADMDCHKRPEWLMSLGLLSAALLAQLASSQNRIRVQGIDYIDRFVALFVGQPGTIFSRMTSVSGI